MKYLQFANRNSGLLFLNPKNILHWLQIFCLKSCLRSHLEYYIPATINKNELNYIFQNLNVNSNDLFKQQTSQLFNLDWNIFLKYLYKRHQIKAAKNFLLFGNKWWIVDLYSNSKYILYLLVIYILILIKLIENIKIDIINKY